MFCRSRLLALLAAVGVCACSPGEPASGEAAGDAGGSRPLSVYTVAYPLQYFAERIGGDLVRVHFPAPAGVDPASWSPDPETVAAYQTADLVLLNGAGYARWVQRASLPRARLVDTAAAFRDRFIPLDGSVTPGHGPRGAHSHEGVAFTTWLDPTLAAEQARAVAEAFAAARPAHAEVFRQRYRVLAGDLRDLDEHLAAAAQSLAGAPLLFSHPVYQYFVRRYALNARSLHWEPDAPPSPAMWRELAKLRADHPANALLWEGPPAPATTAELRARGVASAIYAPCAGTPAGVDFLEVMRANAAAFAALAVNRADGSGVQSEERAGEE